MAKVVITYGTFDLFHYGHVYLLKRARELGTKLIVGVSTDEFARIKGKSTVFSYEVRADMVMSLRCVDQVIPERCWEQKQFDIVKYSVDVFTIGDDWTGKFDYLRKWCDVVYLPRTKIISTTLLKHFFWSKNECNESVKSKGTKK